MGATQVTTIERASDAQLLAHLDNVVADYALAVKYEHNAYLVPIIQTHWDKVVAEMKKRGMYHEH